MTAGGSVGGITFTIKVDTGDTAKRVRAVHKEFRELDKNASKLSKRLQSVVSQLTAIGASRTGGLRNMATQLQLVDRYAKSVAKSANAVAASALRSARAHNAASRATQTHAMSLDTYSDKAGTAMHAASALAGVLSSRFLTYRILDAAKLAARVEVLGTTLDQLGGIANYSSGELAILEQQTKALGITTQAARESLALLVRNQLDMAKAAQLARVAQDSAVLAGENSSESFARIATAIEKLEPRLLKAIGINVRLEQVYSAQADALGKTVDSLTERERKEALLNAVLAKGVTLTGLYEASMQDVGKQLTSLPRYLEEAKKEFGEQFLPVLRDGVNVIGDLAKWYAELPEPIKNASAAIAAGGTVAVGATASVAGLTLALGALNSVLLATPAGWIGLSLAALAGTYVLVESAAASARREVEELNKAARAKGATAAQSMDESKLENHIAGLIRKQQALERLRKSVAKTAAANADSSLGVSLVTGGELVLAMTRQIELTKQELIGVKEAQEAIEMRRLDSIMEQQTNAYATAIEIEKDLHKERRKALVGSTMEIIDEFRKQRTELENSVMSIEDIQRAYDLSKLKAVTALNKKYRTKREEVGDDEAAQRRVQVEYTQELVELEQQLANARDAEFSKRDQILDGLRESVALAEQRLEAERKSLTQRREILDAEDVGAVAKIVEMEAERVEKLEQQKAALQELQELRVKAIDTDQFEIYSKRIAQLIEDIQLTQEESIRKQIQAIEDAADKRRDTMEKLANDLARIEGDTTQMTIEEINKRRQQRERDFENTEKFITRIRTALMEAQNPGRAGLTSQFDDFLEAVNKAGSARQLDQLMESFPEVLKLTLSEMEKEATKLQQKINSKATQAQRDWMRGDGAALQRFMTDTAKDRFALSQLSANFKDGMGYAQHLQKQMQQAIDARRIELENVEKLKKEEDRIRREKADQIKREMEAAQKGIQWESDKLDILKQQLAVTKELLAARIEATGTSNSDIMRADELRREAAKLRADAGKGPDGKPVVTVTPVVKPAPTATTGTTEQPTQPRVTDYVPPSTTPRNRRDLLNQRRLAYQQEMQRRRDARARLFSFMEFGASDTIAPPPAVTMPTRPTQATSTATQSIDTSAAEDALGRQGEATERGLSNASGALNGLADIANDNAEKIDRAAEGANVANRRAQRIKGAYQ